LLSCKALIFLLAEDHAMKHVVSHVKRVLPLVNSSITWVRASCAFRLGPFCAQLTKARANATTTQQRNSVLGENNDSHPTVKMPKNWGASFIYLF
jgi:hypothetical protein